MPFLVTVKRNDILVAYMDSAFMHESKEEADTYTGAKRSTNIKL
jgi:hypothetical protein